MSATCPAGHQSESTDYCDTCGMPIAGFSGEGAGAGTASGGTAAGATSVGGSAAGGSAAGGSAAGGSAAMATSGSAGAAGPDTGSSPGPAARQECPSCSADNPGDALFCEACGYDFTTGTMPRAPEAAAAPGLPNGGSLDLGSADPDSGSGDGTAAGAAAGATGSALPPLAGTVAVEWVVEVWVDPDWYSVQSSDDPCPSPGLPIVHPLRTTSLLVGRPSASRHIVPDVDCSSDTGVSRRQAQLTTDGRRWWVEDLQSSNGTWVAPASGPLPSDPVPPGQRRELAEDDRVYVGAWTRLVVRRATPEEQADYA